MVAWVQGEKPAPSASMSRFARPLSTLGRIGVGILYIGLDCFQAVTKSSSSAQDDPSQRGIRAKLFGWPPPKLDPKRETAWLDGLRGVAATLVVIYHFHLTWFGVRLEAPWGSFDDFKWHFWRLPFFRLFWSSGHAQVSVFFVLSGFVLSWGALNSIRKGRNEKFATSLGSSTFRRWFRLYMPCFCVGFVDMILFRWNLISIVVTPHETIFKQINDWVWASYYWSDPFHLERNGGSLLYSYNWTMWTIPLEFAGSFLVFVLLISVNRIQDYKKRLLVILFVSGYSYAKALWTYWLFSAGIIVADYVQEAGGFEKLSNSTSRPARLFWILVFMVGAWLAGVPENNALFPKPGYEFLYRWTPSSWSGIEGGVRFWWSWSGVLILVGACHLALLRRIFAMSFIRYLGRISYMLYVTHRTVEEVLGNMVRPFLARALGDKKNILVENKEIEIYVPTNIFWSLLIWLSCWLIIGSSALIIAHWFEVLVDGPCTRFSRWLDDRFTKGFFSPDQRATQEESIGLLPISSTNERGHEMNGRVD